MARIEAPEPGQMPSDHEMARARFLAAFPDREGLDILALMDLEVTTDVVSPQMATTILTDLIDNFPHVKDVDTDEYLR